MRTFLLGSSFIIMAGMLSGCHSSIGSIGPKPAAPAVAPASAPVTATSTAEVTSVAMTKACVMQSGGADVLKLTVPIDSKCVAGDGSLHFNPEQRFEVEFWLVRGANTADDAMDRVNSLIKPEFNDLKPAHITDLMIAGSPAKRVVGPGHEADDGDPGAADVIVFKVGRRVFIACTHGETLDPEIEQWMLTMVQSAQMP